MKTIEPGKSLFLEKSIVKFVAIIISGDMYLTKTMRKNEFEKQKLLKRKRQLYLNGNKSKLAEQMKRDKNILNSLKKQFKDSEMMDDNDNIDLDNKEEDSNFVYNKIFNIESENKYNPYFLENESSLHNKEIIHLKKGTIVGLEALMRIIYLNEKVNKSELIDPYEEDNESFFETFNNKKPIKTLFFPKDLYLYQNTLTAKTTSTVLLLYINNLTNKELILEFKRLYPQFNNLFNKILNLNRKVNNSFYENRLSFNNECIFSKLALQTNDKIIKDRNKEIMQEIIENKISDYLGYIKNKEKTNAKDNRIVSYNENSNIIGNSFEYCQIKYKEDGRCLDEDELNSNNRLDYRANEIKNLDYTISNEICVQQNNSSTEEIIKNLKNPSKTIFKKDNKKDTRNIRSRSVINLAIKSSKANNISYVSKNNFRTKSILISTNKNLENISTGIISDQINLFRNNLMNNHIINNKEEVKNDLNIKKSASIHFNQDNYNEKIVNSRFLELFLNNKEMRKDFKTLNYTNVISKSKEKINSNSFKNNGIMRDDNTITTKILKPIKNEIYDNDKNLSNKDITKVSKYLDEIKFKNKHNRIVRVSSLTKFSRDKIKLINNKEKDKPVILKDYINLSIRNLKPHDRNILERNNSSMKININHSLDSFYRKNNDIDIIALKNKETKFENNNNSSLKIAKSTNNRLNNTEKSQHTRIIEKKIFKRLDELDKPDKYDKQKNPNLKVQEKKCRFKFKTNFNDYNKNINNSCNIAENKYNHISKSVNSNCDKNNNKIKSKNIIKYKESLIFKNSLYRNSSLNQINNSSKKESNQLKSQEIKNDVENISIGSDLLYSINEANTKSAHIILKNDTENMNKKNRKNIYTSFKYNYDTGIFDIPLFASKN